MQALFDVILPVFVVIGFGYAATWLGLFSDAALDGVLKFTQNFAIPCLLFSAISKIDLSIAINTPLIVSYYGGAFAGFAAGFLGARLVFYRSPEDSVAIGFCCFHNPFQICMGGKIGEALVKFIAVEEIIVLVLVKQGRQYLSLPVLAYWERKRRPPWGR